ncbi:MAG: ABC transporter ATP-binding protein [Planctomycetales bacterium]|nr:ABC transporter ATP-binding protein [bacterium]UNM07415.1 MAG: ABC transporter ATP-binding protein [Planctomycetales bacterium]
MPDQLVLRDCSASLDGQPIIQPLSLELPSPGLHCLIGSNGAGKTTLLRLLCGLLDRTSGSVEFGGRDLLRMNGRDRAKYLGYVPQIADAGIPLNVRDSLEVARLSNSRSRADIDSLLARLNLSALADRPLSRLSGGELKRAMIAQALAQDTQLLLLDEPTAHLDPPARREVMQLMRDIARQDGRLVLCSLHYPELAAEFANSVVLLRDGALLGHGDPQEMTTDAMLAELYAGSSDRVEAAT